MMTSNLYPQLRQEPYRMLQVVVDNIPQFIFWKDRQLAYIDCNRSYAAYVGLNSPAHILGRTEAQLHWSEAEAAYLNQLDNAVMASNQPSYNVEFRAEINGQLHWLRTSRIPLHDDSGAVVGILGIIEEITDHKETENALRESREMLQLVMDNIPQAIFWKNRDYVILGGNRNFFIDAGDGTPASVIGKTDYELTYRVEEADFFREVDRRVMETDTPEYRIIEPQLQADGKQAWLETNKIPLHDADGVVVGILGTYEDITERKEAEEALRRAYDDLEKRVAERTAELSESNERLRREIERRERIEEALRLSEQRYTLATSAGKVCVWDWHLETNAMYLAPGLTDLLGLDEGYAPADFDDWLTLIHPADRPAVMTTLHAHLNGTTPHCENKLRMTHADGSPRWFLWRGTVIRAGDGRPLRVTGSITDITDLTRAQEAEHEQRMLAEALCDTADLLNSTLDLEEVLDRILRVIGRVVPHKTASIMLVDDNCGRIVRYQGEASSAEGYPRLSAGRIRLSEMEHLNQMRHSRRPLCIQDTLREPSHWADLPEHDWIRSYVGTPICLKGEVIGFLNLHSAVPGFFTPVHAERLQAFANQAASAIQNARSFERAQALAALEERQRLARDLHDAVSQTLWSANLTAEVLPGLWEQDITEGRKSLNDLCEFTRGALAEMRALLIELRPSGLVETRLSTLLRQLVESMSNRLGVHISLRVEGGCLLPPDTQVAFYRIAQEALNNIARHTTATWSEVYLNHEPGYAELRICDNGSGFDPVHVPSGRLGLSIMYERAASIGARLEVNSAPGSGTQIMVTWRHESGVMAL